MERAGGGHQRGRRADPDQRAQFNPISVSNQDAQIVEQLKLTDRTVAAVMGVPAILLGISDTATQKSAEAMMSEWLASGLGWLINHIEVAFDAFIGLNAVAAGREWTEFDTKALLRSLFKEQIDGLGALGAGGHPRAQRCAQRARLGQRQGMAMSRACSSRWCR